MTLWPAATHDCVVVVDVFAPYMSVWPDKYLQCCSQLVMVCTENLCYIKYLHIYRTEYSLSKVSLLHKVTEFIGHFKLL